MFSFPITISPGTNNETEKSPFLEPVRLTPAWEENNLPNDELNFRGKYGPWEKGRKEGLCSFAKYRCER